MTRSLARRAQAFLFAGMSLMFVDTASFAQSPLTPSPSWTAAMPTGPDTRVKITEAYARVVARDSYFWAWPMINIYNRRLAFKQAPEPGLMNGVLPLAPLNTLSMLHDYIEPEQRWVACPNQDVVYGAGIAALEEGPVVVQVPDFGKRFWVYQAVGAKTNTILIAPRVFQDDTPEDKQAIQSVISAIDVYPLKQFDGKMKVHDWTKLPKFASPGGSGGQTETRWVFPETFLDQLPEVLKDAPALPGEEARYAEIFAVLSAAQKDPALKKAMIDEATKADKELVDPLLQFRNWGQQLPNHWSAVSNGAAFGTDYFARTAVARSNILVNAPRETSYMYQDLDATGGRLNGANCRSRSGNSWFGLQSPRASPASSQWP